MARCSTCGRERQVTVPPGATPNAEAAIKALARVCPFCTTAQLLHGGYVPQALTEYLGPDEAGAAWLAAQDVVYEKRPARKKQEALS